MWMYVVGECSWDQESGLPLAVYHSPTYFFSLENTDENPRSDYGGGEQEGMGESNIACTHATFLKPGVSWGTWEIQHAT